MVFSGLSTAWRLAIWPTSRSPVLVKATTDGVRRLPSLFMMTVGCPPSMTATTEFVVPRSIPTALAITTLLFKNQLFFRPAVSCPVRKKAPVWHFKGQCGCSAGDKNYGYPIRATGSPSPYRRRPSVARRRVPFLALHRALLRHIGCTETFPPCPIRHTSHRVSSWEPPEIELRPVRLHGGTESRPYSDLHNILSRQSRLQ